MFRINSFPTALEYREKNVPPSPQSKIPHIIQIGFSTVDNEWSMK